MWTGAGTAGKENGSPCSEGHGRACVTGGNGGSGTTVHSQELLEATGYVISHYSDTLGPGMYLCSCRTVLANRHVLNNVAERMREHVNDYMHL